MSVMNVILICRRKVGLVFVAAALVLGCGASVAVAQSPVVWATAQDVSPFITVHILNEGYAFAIFRRHDWFVAWTLLASGYTGASFDDGTAFPGVAYEYSVAKVGSSPGRLFAGSRVAPVHDRGKIILIID